MRKAILRPCRGSDGRTAARLVVLILLATTAGFDVCHARFAPPGDQWRAGPRGPGDSADPVLPLYAMRPPYLCYHNAGLLGLMVTNVGVLGSLSAAEYFGAAWRGGEYLWGAALWVGAVAPDGLGHVSTGYGWTEEGEFELRPGLAPDERIYATLEGATGGDRPGFAENRGDDDGDGRVDEDFLNGRDDDDDKRIDEDYAAISQQMFSCEYGDDTAEAANEHPNHRALHLKVRQRSFAWSTEGSNEFVGLDYVVANRGFETLRDVYIGLFVDADVGRKEIAAHHTDDLGGYAVIDTGYADRRAQYVCTSDYGVERDCSWRPLRVEFAYMYDAPGSIPRGMAADDPAPEDRGYIGAALLGHTLDVLGDRAPGAARIHSCRFFSGSGTYPSGHPQNDYERYDLLSGGARPPAALSSPADYRFCISAGPFRELAPAEELEVQFALAVGPGLAGLIASATAAQKVRDGEWRDADGLRETGCEGHELCLHVADPAKPLLWQDPCDAVPPPPPPLKVRNTTCELSRYWVDNDCDCCTPLQVSADSCLGWETLARWVGTVAPPPPRVGIEDPETRARAEGDRRITIEWDNTSELIRGRAADCSFCGYRIWRVDGWRRPAGSFGPEPAAWQPVAELAADPRGFQLDLRDHTNEFAAVVDTLPAENPGDDPLLRYAVGRYFYVDSLGLTNGMLYFYDVTAYCCWRDELGRYRELDSQPAARESEGVRPRWTAAAADDWRGALMVIPNPWQGSAAWDLIPRDADPSGTHIDFVNLPNRGCDIRIYTLAGDLVQTLHHDPGAHRSGATRWNMITRNGQDITSGVYLYAVTCGVDTQVGRFTVIR